MKTWKRWDAGARCAALRCAVVALALALSACDVVDSDTAGAGRGAEGLDMIAAAGEAAVTKVNPNSEFFPLAIGNTWEYEGSAVLVIRDLPPITMRSREVHTLTGHETLFDREYVIQERSILMSEMPPVVVNWYRYRQDKAGLYEAGVSITQPPGGGIAGAPEGPLATGAVSPWPSLFSIAAAGVPVEQSEAFEAARDEMLRKLSIVRRLLVGGSGRELLGGPPGGVLPDELTRLRYPLRIGQEWTIRDAPLFMSVVEAHEVLDLPAGRLGGWRIRINSELYGPNDSVLIWYGRKGLLETYVHLETEMVGPSGDPLGTMTSTEILTLRRFMLF